MAAAVEVVWNWSGVLWRLLKCSVMAFATGALNFFLVVWFDFYTLFFFCLGKMWTFVSRLRVQPQSNLVG